MPPPPLISFTTRPIWSKSSWATVLRISERRWVYGHRIPNVVQVVDGFFLTSFDSNAGCTGGSGGPDSVGHGAEYSAGGCPAGPRRIRRGRRSHGCILADSVGLGKTYPALAVVRYCEQRNERVLVLYQARNGHMKNINPAPLRGT